MSDCLRPRLKKTLVSVRSWEKRWTFRKSVVEIEVGVEFPAVEPVQIGWDTYRLRLEDSILAALAEVQDIPVAAVDILGRNKALAVRRRAYWQRTLAVAALHSSQHTWRPVLERIRTAPSWLRPARVAHVAVELPSCPAQATVRLPLPTSRKAYRRSSQLLKRL